MKLRTDVKFTDGEAFTAAVAAQNLLRFRDGRHVSFNLAFDRLLMLEQLGIVPAAAA